MPEVQRSTIFGGEAEQYDRFRPGYPSEIIDRLVEHRPAVAVDAGCGTGKAATLVVQRGTKVVGVEPDPRMAEIARRHGIDVSVSKLEDWDVVECDVLYAAQAWHWIDPSRGAEIASASIRQGGRWAAFWNHETDAHFGDILDGVYRRLAPDLIDEDASTSEDELRAAIADGLRATTRTRRTDRRAGPVVHHPDLHSRATVSPLGAHADEDWPVKARRSTRHPQALERLSASRGAVR